MTVSIILATKGREIVTIELAATLKSAVALLAEKRVGAVLVLDADNRVVGILAERDIVRALAEGGAAALDEPVSGSMTRNFSTCTESETIASLMERMTDGKFRHVPVLDQARLVGIVSIGDVVKHRLEEMERDSEALMRALASRLEFSVLKTGDGFTLLRTADVMPPVCEERLTLKQAEELLRIWKLRGGG